MRYRAPTLTWGRIQIRTLQVISPRRIPSRSRLVNVIKRVYVRWCSAPSMPNSWEVGLQEVIFAAGMDARQMTD